MSQATLGDSPFRNSNLFSNYYLKERVQDLDAWDCDEEAEAVFQEIKELWNEQRELLDSYKEDELLDVWIDEILEILGFESLSETTLPGETTGYNDRLLFESRNARTEASHEKADGRPAAMYNLSSGFLEAKQWDADFTKRFNEDRPYRNASHQVKHYLEHTPPHVEWGILTNGRKWRLYGTKDYETETFFEVDLPELIRQESVEDLKYFFTFFRPEAFHDGPRGRFFDIVWEESESAARELGEDLQDNVFTALRVLGEGFIESNNVNINPDDEEALSELKEQSLVLLYRLMFILYAESRELIDPKDGSAKDEYDANFSLTEQRREILDTVQTGSPKEFEEYSQYATNIWHRLENLFQLVDQGHDDLGIPPYNGGLFDADEHRFLTDNEVSDRHIAEVIFRLSTTQNGDEETAAADYADLDTRHLGSIYEGLLEHEFRIAPEDQAAVKVDGGQVWKSAEEVSVAEAVEVVDKGELYVVNDEGERKATGAYYTPDYVVTYIVEETINPLLDDIRHDLSNESYERGSYEYISEFYQRTKDLKVLDPAMGSGHFLTKATGYLAEQVMNEVRELETATLFDEQHVRREIAKECIYGVDLNEMAVELAKLSMWLETLAVDQPLAFLDHHLKTGNSLMGSDIEDVLADENGESEAGQITLFQSLDRARRQALEHVMERFQDLLSIDNETLEDIKEMEEVYNEVRDDPLYQHLLAMANVHTAKQFGLDIPSDSDKRMAKALSDGSWDKIESQEWFKSAQARADEEFFFHWELEFPVVFYNENGERRDHAGFDAVIGNPPWVNVGRMKGKPRVTEYYEALYRTAEYQVDLYTLFLEKGISLLSPSRPIGFIVPDPWLANYRTPKIRKFIFVENQPKKIVHTPRSAFPNVGAEHLVVIAVRSDGYEHPVLRGEMDEEGDVRFDDEFSSDLLRSEDGYVVYTHSTVAPILRKVEEQSNELGELYETIRGVGPYHHNKQDQEVIEKRAFHSDHQEDDTYVPELRGKHLSRYNIDWEGDTWISYGNWLAEPREERFFEGKRLLLREILGKRFEVDVIEKKFIVDRGIYIALQNDQSVDLLYSLALLGSKLAVFWFREKYSENDELFPKLRVAHFEKLPIYSISFDLPESERAEIVSELSTEFESYLDDDIEREIIWEGIGKYTENHSGVVHDFLKKVAETQKRQFNSRQSLNLSLLDYLGKYSEDMDLPNIGLFQPTASNILDATTEDYERVRIGDVKIERDGQALSILATARYKPESEEGYDTDQWGYTETEHIKAFTLTDLTEEETALVEAFVPVAAEKADGFAGFRDNATKTNSLIDRLKAIKLPNPDDVADDLQHYIETRERAKELDRRIKETDQLIDKIVYNLYGLTDEEIEMVETAVPL